MITNFWLDLCYSMRMARKHKGLTFIAILSLALGIGANTAIFSLVDAVLLKNLPVKDPEQLVLFKWLGGPEFNNKAHKQYLYAGSSRTDEATGLRLHGSFPRQTFEMFSKQQSLFTKLFAFTRLDPINATADGQADFAGVLAVSGSYFTGLSVRPWLGRTVIEEDDRPDAPAVVVLSFHYWQRRFGESPAVIGKQINLNDAAFTIVGVTPPEFAGIMGAGNASDLTIPLAMEPLVSGKNAHLKHNWIWWLSIMGRLKPGVTQEQVLPQFDYIFQQTRHTPGEDDSNQTPAVTTKPRDSRQLVIVPGRRGDTDWGWYQQQSLHLLMVVVGLVLLIAIINLTNLLLALAAERQKEFGIRLALGAGRLRLVQQMLTESLLLSLTGGVLGLFFALWSKNLLLKLRFPAREMFYLQTGLDWRVLIFTLGISVLTGVLFGFAPAWRATRIELRLAKKNTGKSLVSYSSSRFNRLLVVAQVAISLCLLVGAGLFLRTVHNLQHVELGFNAKNLVHFRVYPYLNGYRNERLNNLYQSLFNRLESVPGVRAVTFSGNSLLFGSAAFRNVYLPGKDNPVETKLHTVRAGFFEVMEMPLLLGRSLSPKDDATAPPVAIVNQNLAHRLFPNENAVGKRIKTNSQEVEIVGVVQDAKYATLREEAPPTIYTSWLQESNLRDMTYEIRTAGAPENFLSAIRQAVREVDNNLPLSNVTTQIELASRSIAQEQLFAILLSFFGSLALLLAALGLYGVLSHSVATRTQEIGIRVALGAETHHLLKMVIGQGMVLVVMGIMAGLAIAYWMTQWLASWMYGVGVRDPLTFTGFAVFLTVIALVACWIPARRATKVDPLIALRSE